MREAGVTSALLHGGTSTVCAIGKPPGARAWKIALEHPAPEPATKPAPLATVPLRDESLSVSAVRGKCFEAGGRTYGHVMDPRTGEPANRAVLAVVIAPSATETDALSTALLNDGAAGLDRIASLRPGLRTLVLFDEDGQLRAQARGISCR